MTTAEAFTKQFVQNELTTSTSATTEHRTVEAIETASVMSEAVSNSTLITGAGALEKSASKKEVTFAEKHQEFYEPPALPPKTKIMNSPSRHLFSPTDEVESGSMASSSHISSEEFVSVKDKIKLIAAQQEEIVRKEERTKSSSSSSKKEHVAGGVRILPPSPTTVRKELDTEDDQNQLQQAQQQQQHLQQLHKQHQTQQQLQQLQKQQLIQQQQLEQQQLLLQQKQRELEQQQLLLKEQQLREQQAKQEALLNSASATSVASMTSASSVEQYMYDAQVSCARETAFDQTQALMMSTGAMAVIPRLEDKFEQQTTTNASSVQHQSASTFSQQNTMTSTTSATQQHQTQSSSQQQFAVTSSSSQSATSSSHFSSTSSSLEQKQQQQRLSMESGTSSAPSLPQPRVVSTTIPNEDTCKDVDSAIATKQARTDSQSHQQKSSQGSADAKIHSGSSNPATTSFLKSKGTGGGSEST